MYRAFWRLEAVYVISAHFMVRCLCLNSQIRSRLPFHRVERRRRRVGTGLVSSGRRGPDVYAQLCLRDDRAGPLLTPDFVQLVDTCNTSPLRHFLPRTHHSYPLAFLALLLHVYKYGHMVLALCIRHRRRKDRRERKSNQNPLTPPTLIMLS
jgi:hypothetical protein